jgi:hypothetical protein
MTMTWSVIACRVAVAVAAAFTSANAQSGGVAQLLATDRDFSRKGEALDVVNALGAMFTADVVMPLPTGTFARGQEEVRAALAANPVNVKGRARWYPVRAGVSADGTHGFTAGYVTTRTDSGPIHAKYLAYWIREDRGWRVAAYKRAYADRAGDTTMMLPMAAEPVTSRETRQAHLASLIAAEKQFSDTAQSIGLGRAFALSGTRDAINMGPASSGFVIGAAAIGASIGGRDTGSTSPVHWDADFAIVAPTGDLGVTFGLIRSNDASGRPPAAFFTIWSRPGARGPWRYIAE